MRTAFDGVVHHAVAPDKLLQGNTPRAPVRVVGAPQPALGPVEVDEIARGVARAREPAALEGVSGVREHDALARVRVGAVQHALLATGEQGAGEPPPGAERLGAHKLRALRPEDRVRRWQRVGRSGAPFPAKVARGGGPEGALRLRCDARGQARRRGDREADWLLQARDGELLARFRVCEAEAGDSADGGVAVGVVRGLVRTARGHIGYGHGHGNTEINNTSQYNLNTTTSITSNQDKIKPFMIHRRIGG